MKGPSVMSRPDAPPYRHAPSFGIGNKLFRVVWQIAWFVLVRFSPPPLYGWRRLILRIFGARIGRNVRVYADCKIWHPHNLTMADGAVMGRAVRCYNQGSVTIMADAIVSQNVTLCASTHDINDPLFPLLLRPIVIERYAWIAAEAFVGPGVTIGEGTVLGARGVAMRDLVPWTFFSGNPAHPLKARDPSPFRGGQI